MVKWLVRVALGWTRRLGQINSLKLFSPQLSTAPICVENCSHKYLQYYSSPATNLYGSDGPVKAGALQIEEDNIGSVGSLFAVVTHYYY